MDKQLEQIKAEIERLDSIVENSDVNFNNGWHNALSSIFQFINSIPEESDSDSLWLDET